MADKSAYMGAGGYGSGYMGSNASSSGYAREDYAQGQGGQSNNNNNNQGGSGGNTNPGGQVFKARTDQSCYLGS
ncbi:Nematode Specific Peptide family, group D [Caenorhabditis elegans]|uniref:Nematode Specific Peptide family, group D n=1 Tax=Caenorhabditis elegans TaxID=6239 RepID=Q8IA53_CAEEL|nr:Nematode Specific Peptide family, group D [Caenorhabditis elegans]CCD71546.1 Nematode Specific Peptide family, group D [Caenorhabditis elegans]|eukprot:NP_871892.1 Nematode Specific Peptide family, group D [Caenorhabditis elegans]